MKKTFVFCAVAILSLMMFSCSSSGTRSEYDGVDKGLIASLYAGNRLQKMQAFIMDISNRAKESKRNFLIIPQDGIDLAFTDGVLDPNMMKAVDGWGIEEIVDSSGPANEDEQKYIKVKSFGKTVTVTDDCSSATLAAYIARCKSFGFLPFPRSDGSLGKFNHEYYFVVDPAINGVADTVHSEDVTTISAVKNYLYLINPGQYGWWPDWQAELDDGDTWRIDEEGDPFRINGQWWWVAKGYKKNTGRAQYLKDLKASNYDMLYIDAFFEDDSPLTKAEVSSLKTKANGGKRLVIAYMNVGAAEPWRYYFESKIGEFDWDNPNDIRGRLTGSDNDPAGYTPNPGAKVWMAFGYGGQYSEETVVAWEHQEWRNIIYDYLKKIIAAGFDGVYLDNVGVYDRPGWVFYDAYIKK